MVAIRALLTSSWMGWTSSKLYYGHAEQVCFMNTEAALKVYDAPVYLQCGFTHIFCNQCH